VKDSVPEGLQELLTKLERDWAEPRQTIHRGKPTVLPLSVRLERIVSPPPSLAINAPPEVLEFWRGFRTARLFEDRRYSQWGLVLVPPESSQELTDKLHRDRARDALPGDVVVGEFLGDSDLLVARADPAAADYGAMLVALPLDRRRDWVGVGSNLKDFLRRYAETDGAKFWEPGS
jgi:hypothetical protein